MGNYNKNMPVSNLHVESGKLHSPQIGHFKYPKNLKKLAALTFWLPGL